MAKYLHAAALSDDPIQRMKFVMASMVCYIMEIHSWGKPLNPILGETYEATLPDGSTVHIEQISHHPPISYLLLCGPDDIYSFSGYAGFCVRAYMNSVNLEVTGFK